MRVHTPSTTRRGIWKRLDKIVETIFKTLIAFGIYPIPVIVVVLYVWHELHVREIHFNDKLEIIATAAWIPIFGIFYGLFAVKMIDSVWGEYKEMRAAIKVYDFETYVRLHDEDVSPLAHTFMSILALAVLSAFMGLAYPDEMSGYIVIGSTAYLFTLMFILVVELDNPLAGLWVIKTIHEEWKVVDIRQWRKLRYDEAREAFKNEGIKKPDEDTRH